MSKMHFLTQRLLPSDDLIVFVRRQKAIEIDNALSGGCISGQIMLCRSFLIRQSIAAANCPGFSSGKNGLTDSAFR